MEGLFVSAVRLKTVPEGGYLAALPVVRHLAEAGELCFDRAVTFLVGENGTGKSTLLEGIAVAAGFNAEGGSKNFNFATRESHSELHSHLTLVRRGYPRDGFFLRAESFYNAASYIDDITVEGSYGGLSLHRQSHGESFLALVRHRFGGGGLYLLDEPEAALSPTGILTLMAELHRLALEGSQFIIATHSPMLLALPEARIFELSEAGIAPAEYRETGHYRLTRRFLEDPGGMLGKVLE